MKRPERYIPTLVDGMLSVDAKCTFTPGVRPCGRESGARLMHSRHNSGGSSRATASRAVCARSTEHATRDQSVATCARISPHPDTLHACGLGRASHVPG
jgi:hypothetical protein